MPWRTFLPSSAALVCAAGPVAALEEPVIDLRGEPDPAAPGTPYSATGLPDRIVLSPGGDASSEMQISWRTDITADASLAESAELVPAPGFGQRAMTIVGSNVAAVSENGQARYHKARLTDLRPDTSYAYRVRGSAGFQIGISSGRPKPEPRPSR